MSAKCSSAVRIVFFRRRFRQEIYLEQNKNILPDRRIITNG
jgi:hypothetical protein